MDSDAMYKHFVDTEIDFKSWREISEVKTKELERAKTTISTLKAEVRKLEAEVRFVAKNRDQFHKLLLSSEAQVERQLRSGREHDTVVRGFKRDIEILSGSVKHWKNLHDELSKRVNAEIANTKREAWHYNYWNKRALDAEVNLESANKSKRFWKDKYADVCQDLRGSKEAHQLLIQKVNGAMLPTEEEGWSEVTEKAYESWLHRIKIDSSKNSKYKGHNFYTVEGDVSASFCWSFVNGSGPSKYWLRLP